MGRVVPPENQTMNCVICKDGETKPGAATVTLERDGLTVVFKSVPAAVCENCGEQYVDAQTTARLLAEAEQAAKSGVAVEVRTYLAA
jgi:YgiT-type zinc finger domain-containing protein